MNAKTEVYAKVKEIIVDLLEVDPELVTPGASFKETLEADSLDLVELLMEFEDAFGSPIPDEDVKKIVTVGDAVAYIEKQGDSLLLGNRAGEVKNASDLHGGITHGQRRNIKNPA